MKLFIFGLIGFLGITSPNTDKPTKQIDLNQSIINWTGKKVTGKHTGTLALKEGHLEFDGSNLTGGNFVIDMTSMACTDLEGGMASKLIGHLNSADFFAVDQFPTATLNITEVKSNDSNHTIMGDLTIKGITKPITFDATIMEDKAKANIKVDRTLYGIKYGSGSFFDNLGDKTIYDDFELEVDLTF